MSNGSERGDALQYIEIPDSLRKIGDNAFQSIKFKHSIHTGKNVYYIGDLAFNACFSSGITFNFTIGHAVRSMGRYSITYFNSSSNCEKIYFGEPDKPSQLETTRAASDAAPIIAMNNYFVGNYCGGIEIYCSTERKSFFDNLIQSGIIQTNPDNQFDISVTEIG